MLDYLQHIEASTSSSDGSIDEDDLKVIPEPLSSMHKFGRQCVHNCCHNHLEQIPALTSVCWALATTSSDAEMLFQVPAKSDCSTTLGLISKYQGQ